MAEIIRKTTVKINNQLTKSKKHNKGLDLNRLLLNVENFYKK
jgi:hypothetical protein